MTYESPQHLACGPIDQNFVAVLVKAAEKEGRTFFEQLVAFAVLGAECKRNHDKKEQHIRKRRTK